MQCLVGTEVFTTQRRAVLAAATEELQLPPRTTGTEMPSSGWFPVKCVKCLDRALEEGGSVRWGNDRAANFKLISKEEAEKGEQERGNGGAEVQREQNSYSEREDFSETVTEVALQLGRVQNKPVLLVNRTFVMQYSV